MHNCTTQCLISASCIMKTIISYELNTTVGEHRVQYIVCFNLDNVLSEHVNIIQCLNVGSCYLNTWE